ncbi:MAG: hypothetical protein FD149_1784 [Rhodospirillaceae bacterium]|nr:MAG: hypothetical protein FD149_1784 [Rhodospirillaceae bacterium]
MNHYVQLGLFAKENSVEIASRIAARHQITLHVDPVEVKGRLFQRLRCGPYRTREEAQTAMAVLNEIFQVDSILAAIPAGP